MFDVEALEKLGKGDYLSFEITTNKSYINYVQEDIMERIDYMPCNEKFLTHFFINIYVSDSDDKKTHIGELKGEIIAPPIDITEGDFFTVCDEEDQELCEMAESLLNDDHSLNKKLINELDCVCCVSRFYIDKEFRNLGIGEFVLNNLPELIAYQSNIFITKIVLCPVPLERDEDGVNYSRIPDNKELEESLKNFYVKNNFKPTPNNYYYICDC